VVGYSKERGLRDERGRGSKPTVWGAYWKKGMPLATTKYVNTTSGEKAEQKKKVKEKPASQQD